LNVLSKKVKQHFSAMSADIEPKIFYFLFLEGFKGNVNIADQNEGG
jgi:hypothetical protein